MECGVDVSSLTRWMSEQGLGTGPIVDAQRLTGGTQNILLGFRREGRGYVLRSPPPHPRPGANATMRREARVLEALAGTAVPHPRLIAVCDDPAVLGATFYLMEPVDGFNPTAGLPPLHAGEAGIRHRMGLALAEALAAIGDLNHAAIGLADFGKPEGYLDRQVARWQGQLDGYAEFSGWPGPAALGDVGAIGAWLDAHRPPAAAPGLMHGDFHLANVMFRPDGPELAAVIDWELATIGDPLVDLGWLIATWPEPGDAGAVRVTPWLGFPTAIELIAHYRTRSRRDVGAIDWYAILGCYKLGVLLEGTYARAMAGKAPREVGERLHARSRSLFDRARRWIERGLPTDPGELQRA